MILQYVLLIVGLLCVVAALALVLRPKWPAALPAYAALVSLHLSYFIAAPTSTFVFWGIATAMVVALYHFSPKGEPDGNAASNLYIGGSTIAGCLLGLIVGPRIMVLGTVLGAAVGQMAYARTPAGRWLTEQPATFIRYFCAKCLPAIVAVAITGIAVEGLIIQ